jgi:glycosyltransferase involved in cell wall biosynthesis
MSGAPLSVLHVLAPAAHGGLERVVGALAAGHAARGHPVHVAAVLSPRDGPGEAHPFVAALRQARVRVHVVRTGPRHYLRERAAVGALCEQVRPDVVHTHGYRADVVDAPVARERGIASATTVHGFTGGGLKNRLFERMQRAAFRGFGAVVAVSRPLAGMLAASGVPAPVLHLIPNAWSGEPQPLEPAAARRRLGISSGVFHVGWVGRLSAEKAPALLLEAVARLAGLPLAVSLLGEGPERAALAARAGRLGIAGQVHFHGPVERAGALMPAFDVLVLSSRTEGTPVVLFEAMAAEVPIVATRVGGVPDVTGEDGAVLVPPGDPAALAAALRAVYRAPDDAFVRARAARRRLASRFAREPWLDAYESLYRQLATRQRSP